MKSGEGFLIYLRIMLSTPHPWCGDHSININACGVWEERVGVQVSKREFHTHIHLNYARVEILSYIYIYIYIYERIILTCALR